MREKLIELLERSDNAYSKFVHETSFVPDKAKFTADHLIANDVVIPVRCKDCWKWYPYNGGGSHDCPYCGYPDADFYCGEGERRTE